MIKFPYLILLLIFFNSCSSYLNEPIQVIRIETNKPCEMTVNGEKLQWISSHQVYTAVRSKDSLQIRFKKDSLIKQIKVPAHQLSPSDSYAYPSLVYSDIYNPTVDYLTYRPSSLETLEHKNILKLTPINSFEPINPDFELTYERQLSKHFSTQVGTAYLLPFHSKDFDTQIKGFTLSLQARYFFNSIAPLGKYIAFEVYYLRNNYKARDSFQDTTIKANQQTNVYTDTFNIKRQTLSFNFLYGYQYHIAKFTFDFYCGLGIRYHDVVHYGQKKEEISSGLPKEFNFQDILNQEGQFWTPNFSLNFRIGYNF